MLPVCVIAQVNGKVYEGDVEELLDTLRDQVGPLVVGDDQVMRTVSFFLSGFMVLTYIQS